MKAAEPGITDKNTLDQEVQDLTGSPQHQISCSSDEDYTLKAGSKYSGNSGQEVAQRLVPIMRSVSHPIISSLDYRTELNAQLNIHRGTSER